MSASERLSSVQYAYIDSAVPSSLHSLIHAFVLQQRWSATTALCGNCLYVVSHHSDEQQLLAVCGSVARLRNVVLLSSALFLSPGAADGGDGGLTLPLQSPPPPSALSAALSLFAGYRLSSTALPTAQRALCFLLAAQLSASTSTVFDASITHLLAASSASTKYGAAHRSPSTAVLSPSWVLECFRQCRLLPISGFLHPLLAGARISVTGVEAAEREAMRATIRAHGGQYDPNLTKECTHLIALNTTSDKYKHARLWELHVVTADWLTRSVDQHRLLPEADFPVPPHEADAPLQPRAGEITAAAHALANGGTAPLHGEEDDEAGGHEDEDEDEEKDEEEQAEHVVEQHRREAAREQQRQEEERRETEERRRREEEDDEAEAGGSADAGGGGWRKKSKKPVKEPRPKERQQRAQQLSPPPPPPPPLPPAARPVSPAPMQRMPRPPPSPPLSPGSPRVSPPSSSSSASSSPPSASTSLISPAYDAADDSFLDAVQALLAFPTSSPLYRRLLFLLRSGGATRLPSYRPSVTHIVAASLAHVEQSLKADRFAVGFTSVEAIAAPIVSAEWLERCVEMRKVVGVSDFLLEDERSSSRPPGAGSAVASGSQRLSSAIRQRTVSDFSAFNASIAAKAGVHAPPLSAKERRRRLRAQSVGAFGGRVFVFHGLSFEEEQDALLRVRKGGGDLQSDGEGDDDVDFVIAATWQLDLPVRYPNAVLVTPRYVEHCLAVQQQQPQQQRLSPSSCLLYAPIPSPLPVIADFSAFTFALTGFTDDREERFLLVRALQEMGAAQVTAGLNKSNTHCVCKEGMAEGRKWEYAFGGRWKGRMVKLQWVVECARLGRAVDTAPWLWRKEEGNAERLQQERAAAVTEAQSDSVRWKASAGRATSPPAVYGDADRSASGTAQTTLPLPDDDDAVGEALQVELADEEANTAELKAADGDGAPTRSRRGPTRSNGRAQALSTSAKERSAAANSGKSRETEKAVPAQSGAARPLEQPSDGGRLTQRTDADISQPAPPATGSRMRRERAEDEKRPTEPSPPPPATPEPHERERETDAAAFLNPLPAPTPSTTSDPFAGPRYGRQHGTTPRTNRIYTPPKALAASSPAKLRPPSVEPGGRKRALAVLDGSERGKAKAKAAEEGGDPFSFPNEDVSAGERSQTTAASKGGDKKRRPPLRPDGPSDERLDGSGDAAKDGEAVAKESGKAPTATARADERAQKRATECEASEATLSDVLATRPALMEDEQSEAEQDAEAKRTASADDAEDVTATATAVEEDNTGGAEAAAAARSERNGHSSAARKAAIARVRAARSVEASVPPAPRTPRATRAAREQATADSASLDDASLTTTNRASARAQRKQALKAQVADSPVLRRPLKRKAAPAASSISSDSAASASASKRAKSARGAAASASSSPSSSSSSSGSSDADAPWVYQFALSSFKAHHTPKYRGMIEALGGLVIPDTSSDYSLCSAVITAELSLRRTEKVLIAIVAGLPLLPRDYIERSHEHGAFLSISGWRLKRGQPELLGELADVLLRAGERWSRKRPFRGWKAAVWDEARSRMLGNVLRMGEGEVADADADGLTHALVGDWDVQDAPRKAEAHAWLKAMWTRGVTVYRSDFLLDFVCYSDRRDWAPEAYAVAKDSWTRRFVNPTKNKPSAAHKERGDGVSHSSQHSTAVTDGADVGRRATRRRS